MEFSSGLEIIAYSGHIPFMARLFGSWYRLERQVKSFDTLGEYDTRRIIEGVFYLGTLHVVKEWEDATGIWDIGDKKPLTSNAWSI